MAHPFADLTLTTLPNSLNPFPLRALPTDHCLSSTPMQAPKLTIPEHTTSLRSPGARRHPIYPTYEVTPSICLLLFTAVCPPFDHEITGVIFEFLAHCRQ